MSGTMLAVLWLGFTTFVLVYHIALAVIAYREMLEKSREWQVVGLLEDISLHSVLNHVPVQNNNFSYCSSGCCKFN